MRSPRGGGDRYRALMSFKASPTCFEGGFSCGTLFPSPEPAQLEAPGAAGAVHRGLSEQPEPPRLSGPPKLQRPDPTPSGAADRFPSWMNAQFLPSCARRGRAAHQGSQLLAGVIRVTEALLPFALIQPFLTHVFLFSTMDRDRDRDKSKECPIRGTGKTQE